jgi:signal transduction histidine kinase
VNAKERIFEPFYSGKEKGLGLGLAMVKNLAQQNNGKIKVQKSDQKGTVFRLILPASEKHSKRRKL